MLVSAHVCCVCARVRMCASARARLREMDHGRWIAGDGLRETAHLLPLGFDHTRARPEFNPENCIVCVCVCVCVCVTAVSHNHAEAPQDEGEVETGEQHVAASNIHIYIYMYIIYIYVYYSQLQMSPP